METVINEFCKTLGFDCCGIFLYDEEKNRFHLVFQKGLDSFLDSIKFITKDGPFFASLASGKEVIISDTETHSSPTVKSISDRVKSLFIFPLLSREKEMLGAFLIGSRSSYFLDEKFARFIGGLASLLGLYLEGEEMRQELKSRFESREKEYKRFSKILDTVNAGIYVVDRNHRIVFVNRVEKEIMKISGDYKGKKCYSIFGLLNVVCEGCPIDDVIKNKEGFTVYEASEEAGFGRKLGGRIANIYYRPINSNEVVVIIEDITYFKEEEKRIRDIMKLKTAGELAVGIVHELSDPLLVCQLSLERLKGKCKGDDVERLEKNLEKISKLVDRLGSFVRPERRTMEKFDLVKLVESTAGIIKKECERSKVALNVELWKDRMEIYSDKSSIELILLNLLLNALEAVKEKGEGEIFVKVYPLSGWFVLEVRDTGIGIPKNIRSKIFEPFFTTKKGSLGVGLSICKAIVSELGGRIEFSSNGETVFKVYIKP